MKYRLAGVLGAVAMLGAVLLLSAMLPENAEARVHQHLLSRGPDAGCDCDGGELCTHLPLVLIDTQGEEIPGEPIGTSAGGPDLGFTLTEEGEAMLSAHITVIWGDDSNHHPSDEPDLESEMLIRVRGNSSRYFDKKGYLIRLTDGDGAYRNEEMMGMDTHYEWALHGPYLDKTLIRNYMWYNLAGEIMDCAPNVRFCEVMVNGEYKGVYVMTETITNGEDARLNISEPIDGTTKTGYALRLDRGSKKKKKNITTFTNFSLRSLMQMNIVYPRSGSLTEELAGAIEQDFSDFEKALYSYDYDTDDYGYDQWIDAGSFADYFIINEFTTNYDAGWLSTYLYKDIGGKYKMVVWDFNSACDNYTQSTMTPQHFEMQNCVWYYMLLKDETFVARIIDRYRELRETILSDDALAAYIDETIDYLGPAVGRNFEVWGYTFSEYRPLRPEDRNPEDHEEAVKQLKESIYNRGAWLDAYIDTLQQYCHESKVKKFNH